MSTASSSANMPAAESAVDPEAIPPSQHEHDSKPARSRPAAPKSMAQQPTQNDPRDPEGFLTRCAGYNKKTGKRCAQGLGKAHTNRSGIDADLTYLPTCYAHKDQLFFAGRCIHSDRDGRCGRLFRWQRPAFELCDDHVGSPGLPCYLLKLPLELRHVIFRNLLPDETTPSPTSNSTAHTHMGSRMLHNLAVPASAPPGATILGPNTQEDATLSAICRLLRVNRQISLEVKDLLYGTVPFTIDIRNDGTYMCGRRLLSPITADGSPYTHESGSEEAVAAFLKNFDFGAVKNYNVHILLENRSASGSRWPIARQSDSMWDEEVEVYDIRDYVSVAVSGILSKSRHLCRLNVRVGLANFQWSEEEVFSNVRKVVEPFERLRNVNQPRLCGVYEGLVGTYPSNLPTYSRRSRPNLFSVPTLPTYVTVLGPGNTRFDLYRKSWESCISGNSMAPKKTAIRAMFSELKTFYSKLHTYLPEVHQTGRRAFLHRARVAREAEDVEAFRGVRNELIAYWQYYLDQEEAKKVEMCKKLSILLDVDTYPSENDFAKVHDPDRKARVPNRPASTAQRASQQPMAHQYPGTAISSTFAAHEGWPSTAYNPLPQNSQSSDEAVLDSTWQYDARPGPSRPNSSSTVDSGYGATPKVFDPEPARGYDAGTINQSFPAPGLNGDASYTADRTISSYPPTRNNSGFSSSVIRDTKGKGKAEVIEIFD